MNSLTTLFILLLLTTAAFGQDAGTAPPAAPRGEVMHFTYDKSRIFPGTFRDYWVYVPRQYDPSKPACLFVDQDGIQFNAPAVFDQLISSGEMPVTIGVFVMHGRVRALSPGALDRFNRSYEYDGLGDNYVRFLLEELLPDVETKTASGGRAIHLSRRAEDRCIAGSSSGAIAAFTAAWERPDSFSRVFSAIGTYVGLRGGNRYPTLIRKTEPRPIRVFLQDGSADQNIYGGDWWMANQEMERALTFAGYEVNHVWGTGGHNGEQATAIFPDAMRWIWKGWPEPVKAGPGSPQLRDILVPGEGWQPVEGPYQDARGLAVNARGEVFFEDAHIHRIDRIGLDGAVTPFVGDARRLAGAAFTPDGRLLTAGPGGVTSLDAGGHASTVARGFDASGVVAASDGSVYAAGKGAAGSGSVWRLSPRGGKDLVASGLKSATGLTLSPDQSLLYAADGASHWVYSYQIQSDGGLRYGQPYYHLHVPDTADDSGAAGMCVDRDGRLYAATRMGIQVCDQAGRVNCIIPLPGGQAESVCLGGERSDTLFAVSGGRVYRRKVRVTGAHAFLAPNKPAPPNL